ncbi:unnamed protein product [Caenorhabditis sp. 36 PRJEB53466]|nr:unnamed protein product [Caenorhabditis sp. 36 PRJEB53466]
MRVTTIRYSNRCHSSNNCFFRERERERVMNVKMSLLVALAMIVGRADAQIDRDWSFEKMCTWYGGRYKIRDGPQASSGDTCQLEFRHPSSSPSAALRYCSDHFPYHITSATHGAQTTCAAEATLICPKDWVQLYGRCYRAEKTLMTWTEAVEHCATWKSRIAFVHREPIVRLWSQYFSRVNRIWAQASESIMEDVEVNRGDRLMVAFYGAAAPYPVPSGSLLRVDGAKHRAMVVCERNPPTNRAESNYLLRRYAEIYWPGFSTDDGMFLRTLSTRNWQNGQKPDDEYCRRVMRPLGAKRKHASLARISDRFLEEFDKDRDLQDRQQITFFRTPFHLREQKTTRDEMLAHECKYNAMMIEFVMQVDKIDVQIEHRQWRNRDPHHVCVGGTSSTAVRLHQQERLAFETVSDARWAPMYCQSKFTFPKYLDCPSGWTGYQRKSGVKWCHRFDPVPRIMDDSEMECRKEQAHLTGFEDGDELTALFELAKKGGVTTNGWLSRIHVGGQRREVCRWGGNKGYGFEKDPMHECSRKRVFEWVHRVADNPPNLESVWLINDTPDNPEPNYVGAAEDCLEIWPQPTGFVVNDGICSAELNSFCGKEAPITFA